MRLVFISDTRGHEPPVPAGDVLIHCGDFSLSNPDQDLQRFMGWLQALPHPHKAFIAGNHDFALEDPDRRSNLHLPDGVHHLMNSAVSIGGMRFWGSPMTPRFGEWAFMQPDQELARTWQSIPENTHILLTHGPPAGTLDLCASGAKAGSITLAARLRSVHPLIHAFGHIHESWGHITHSDGSSTINASTCNLRYRPENPPFVVDIHHTEGAWKVTSITNP